MISISNNNKDENIMNDQDRFIDKIRDMMREFQETNTFSKEDLAEEIIDVSLSYADKRYNEGYSEGIEFVSENND
jgi:hypothetical protein